MKKVTKIQLLASDCPNSFSMNRALFIENELGQSLARSWIFVTFFIFIPFYNIEPFQKGLKWSLPFCATSVFCLGYIAYEYQSQNMQNSPNITHILLASLTIFIISGAIEFIINRLNPDNGWLFRNKNTARRNS